MILNNCSNCGRKPSILRCLPVLAKNYHAYCKCGKSVEPILGNTWTAEVAADMWNRANPQEDGFEFRRDYINYLAAELAKYSIRVFANGHMLTIKQTLDTDEETQNHIKELIKECEYHKQDLTEFYKKRLEPGVKA